MNQYQPNNNSIVENANASTRSFLNQVYSWMSAGLLLTALVAFYLTRGVEFSNGYIDMSQASPILRFVFSSNITFWGLIILQLGVVFILSGMVQRLSSQMAVALFMFYSMLTGVTLSGIFMMYTTASIASTLFVTAGMFAALSMYGYSTKRNLTGMRSFLFMGLIGIILASLVNIFLKSPALMWAITYIGVFVFAGLTAYDTQKLRELGEQLPADDAETVRKHAVSGALTLYLDFINLFIMLLRLLGDRR